MSCTTPGKWLADCVCIIHLHAHSRNAAASVHCCSCCRASTSAVCARGLQVYTVAGGWQHVQLLHNQVAVFAGVVLQYATAGAIPAALHAYGAAEYQPVVRRTAAIGHLVIWYNSCCGLLRMHAVWYDHHCLVKSTADVLAAHSCRFAAAGACHLPTVSVPLHMPSSISAMFLASCQTAGGSPLPAAQHARLFLCG